MSVVRLIVLLYFVADSGVAFGQAAAKQTPTSRTGGSSMGVDIVVYMFDPHPYEQLILPAYQAFLERSDTGPLVALIQHVLPELRAGKRTSYWSPEVYEEEIEILTGRQVYAAGGKKFLPTGVTTREDMRLFVDNSVAPALLELLCVPEDRGLAPKQNMSQTALDNYLYAHSSWIEDHFTGSKQVSGTVPEIKIGEWTQFFTQTEVDAFDAELSQMPRPNDPQILDEGFDNLRSLVRTVKDNPNLKLLYVIL